MTERKDDGGPAFPQFDVVAGERDGHGDVIDAYTTATGGMSLRDWFAGQALSITANEWFFGQTMQQQPQAAAEFAYAVADAMLAERVKA